MYRFSTIVLARCTDLVHRGSPGAYMLANYYSPYIARIARIAKLIAPVILLSLVQLGLAQPTAAAGWYTHAYLGYSQLGDQDFTAENLPQTSPGEVEISSGFVSGLALGYKTNTAVRGELGWEYRSHGSSTQLDSGDTYPEGNYASSVIYINGQYRMRSASDLEPFFGAGFLWAQEVDIDLERNGLEQSFSAGGDFGWQIMAGADYQIASGWQVRLEARYSQLFSELDLTQEGQSGTLKGLGFNPFTLHAGLTYSS